MTRALLALGIALASTVAFAAAGDPAKPRDDAGARSEEIAAAWEARLAESHAKLATARERAAASEQAVGRARHRKYPRGEALDDLVAAVADAREKLAAAEAELPELLEQARRDGVEPGVLRRFEPDE